MSSWTLLTKAALFGSKLVRLPYLVEARVFTFSICTNGFQMEVRIGCLPVRALPFKTLTTKLSKGTVKARQEHDPQKLLLQGYCPLYLHRRLLDFCRHVSAGPNVCQTSGFTRAVNDGERTFLASLIALTLTLTLSTVTQVGCALGSLCKSWDEIVPSNDAWEELGTCLHISLTLLNC